MTLAEDRGRTPHAMWLLFDPLPAYDMAERGMQIALETQRQLAGHLGEGAWAWTEFALRRMSDPMTAWQRVSERPGPEAAVEAGGVILTRVMTDFAEEAGRAGHAACHGLEDMARMLRGEAHVVTESAFEPEID
jgi:hypothetical protein